MKLNYWKEAGINNTERANQVGHAVQPKCTAHGGSKPLFAENYFMLGISFGIVFTLKVFFPNPQRPKE